MHPAQDPGSLALRNDHQGRLCDRAVPGQRWLWHRLSGPASFLETMNVIKRLHDQYASDVEFARKFLKEPRVSNRAPFSAHPQLRRRSDENFPVQQVRKYFYLPPPTNTYNFQPLPCILKSKSPPLPSRFPRGCSPRPPSQAPVGTVHAPRSCPTDVKCWPKPLRDQTVSGRRIQTAARGAPLFCYRPKVYFVKDFQNR